MFKSPVKGWVNGRIIKGRGRQRHSLCWIITAVSSFKVIVIVVVEVNSLVMG
jgi:hypothetical protein